MKAQWIVLVVNLCAFTVTHSVAGGELTSVVEESRLTGGVILLVNADRAIYDEAAATGCTIRGLETDQSVVDDLRKRFLARGIYGKLSVSLFDGTTIPCIDSLVNLVLVEKSHLGMGEVMRVLAPGGTALIKTKTSWETRVKPWPAGVDEWNQYLHDADNNGVAKDSAGPPERLQWTGGSVYGRLKTTMPSVTSMVTDEGRIFTVEDMATAEAGTLPKRYVLLARDAFNGCELWRHPLREWDKEKAGPVKDISVQLQRRVLAVGGKVYCTDGFDGPITVFDGATGTSLSTFENTGNTREFAYEDGIIFGIQGEPFATGVSPGQTKVKDLKIGEVVLYACDARSGARLWQIAIDGAGGYIGGTLSIKGKYLAYVTRDQLFCRNSKNGTERWSRDYSYFEDMPRKGPFVLRYNNSTPTLVMTEERVFCAELDRIKAYAIADGTLLWGGATECNYTKNGDLFHANGLVWTGLLQGLDPATGEVRRELEQNVTGPMSHDRCYRNRITHHYYINSKSGGTDLVALDGSGEFPGPWMRATCGLAMTPSYGRLYSSPYVCACEIGSMLLGFNCTYAHSRQAGEAMNVEPAPRLVKGPASGQESEAGLSAEASAKGQWPTYRHDNTRSGSTNATVSARPKVLWQATLPGQPTAPVIADGLFFAAVRNTHTLYALDSRTGKPRWHFTADGPIDSPPTIHAGLALFGSRDGWVYCLDASSGTLVWKFSDMPTVRLICDSQQLESAWPVNGSVTVKDGLAYFAAGRSSFLDGGIVVYALNPETGEMKHRQVMAGPYDEQSFPRAQSGSTFRSEGFRSGIFSSDGDNLYIRHQGFNPDLSPISPYDIKRPHLMASTGFLCPMPQHRTYWTIDTDLRYGPPKGAATTGPQGDIIAVDGTTFYEVRGYYVGRHPQLGADPLTMYHVYSGENIPAKGATKKGGGPTLPRTGNWKERWSVDIPLAGHAILVAGESLVVAGVPMHADYTTAEMEASYQGTQGGVLWTLSTASGKKTGALDLPAPPVWDGLAAADGHCYLPLKDGTVLCLGHETGKVRGENNLTVYTAESEGRGEGDGSD